MPSEVPVFFLMEKNVKKNVNNPKLITQNSHLPSQEDYKNNSSNCQANYANESSNTI